MDGITIQQFFKQEVHCMLEAYKNFEALIPATVGRGADHRGEDGRFVENLIRSFLRKYLPRELEVLSGFIVRPAVKTNTNDRSRAKDEDRHSTQLDILVYNSAKYPVYLRSDDTVVVPPEGVIGIISVKKTLNDLDVEHELNALCQASKLCRCENLRSPFLALVSMENNISKKELDTYDWIFQKMQRLYSQDENLSFDDMIGYIGAFKQWGIFKARPREGALNEARYVLLEHKGQTEDHLGLQFLLTGILSVYYDNSRNKIGRPGFTAFPSRRKHDKELGVIKAKIPAVLY